jgi:hypothetical protein
MDEELAKALKVAREKVKGGSMEDFQLILDVAQMSFVWVSEEAAREAGTTVPLMIENGLFKTTDIPAEELKAMIVAMSQKGGKYVLPVSSFMGTTNQQLEFRPFYVTKERPFLVGSIVK